MGIFALGVWLSKHKEEFTFGSVLMWLYDCRFAVSAAIVIVIAVLVGIFKIRRAIDRYKMGPKLSEYNSVPEFVAALDAYRIRNKMRPEWLYHQCRKLGILAEFEIYSKNLYR